MASFSYSGVFAMAFLLLLDLLNLQLEVFSSVETETFLRPLKLCLTLLSCHASCGLWETSDFVVALGLPDLFLSECPLVKKMVLLTPWLSLQFLCRNFQPFLVFCWSVCLPLLTFISPFWLELLEFQLKKWKNWGLLKPLTSSVLYVWKIWTTKETIYG